MAVITYWGDNGESLDIPINIDLGSLDDTTLRLRHWFMSDELRDTVKILNRSMLHGHASTPQGRNLLQMAKKQRTDIKNHIGEIECNLTN